MELSRIKDPEVVPMLVETLTKDGSAPVRAEVARLLGDLRDPAAVDPLVLTLKDADSDVRYQAAKALGEIRDRRAVDPLLAALADGDADLRFGAAIALGHIENPAVVKAVNPRVAAALLEAAKDKDLMARTQALEGLALMGDRRAAKPIIRLLEETPASFVRHSIMMSALRGLTGHEFGPDAAAWRAWWKAEGQAFLEAKDGHPGT